MYLLSMKTTIRAFIGTSVISNTKGSYALTIFSDNDHLYMPTGTVSGQNISSHKLALEAILALLTSIKNLKVNNTIILNIYCGDDLIAYEYNVELNEEGSLSSGVKDRELFLEINKLVIELSNKMTVKIIGTDTILKTYSKQVNLRAYRVAL